MLEDLEKLIPPLQELARRAGALELKYYAEGANVMQKLDGSFVTEADQAAEELILEGLAKITPDVPVVAEESVAAGRIPDVSGGTFWLVDPLDGTKEFINRTDEFTVNMALMVNFEPVLGVIYTPVVDELYVGYDNIALANFSGKGDKTISVRPVPTAGLSVITSRSHNNMDKLKEFLGDKQVVETSFRGSSLKFCEIACGRADIYPRLAPTCEWDTAAGDAILRAAGGKIVNLDGSKFIYGKADQKFLNPGFIALSA